MWLVTLVAVAAALLLTGATAVLLRCGLRPVLAALVGALCAVVVTTVAGDLTGAVPPSVSVALASGAAPVGVALAAAASTAGLPPVPLVIAAAGWGALLVPFALVAPPAVTGLCPPTACIVADFGGALPFVVGVGAVVLVPASLIPAASRVGQRPPLPGRVALPLGALAWATFVVWLVALEGAWDEYTPRIAIAAVLAPAAGALGWLVVDRIRGIDATTARAVRMGLLAGIGGIVAPVVAVATPWTPLIGLICGIAGALTYDARALVSARPAVRGAVTAIVVGAIGMFAAGTVGSTIGFAFAARFDVLGYQLLAVLVVLAVGVLVSVPIGLVLARRATPRPAANREGTRGRKRENPR